MPLLRSRDAQRLASRSPVHFDQSEQVIQSEKFYLAALSGSQPRSWHSQLQGGHAVMQFVEFLDPESVERRLRRRIRSLRYAVSLRRTQPCRLPRKYSGKVLAPGFERDWTPRYQQ